MKKMKEHKKNAKGIHNIKKQFEESEDYEAKIPWDSQRKIPKKISK